MYHCISQCSQTVGMLIAEEEQKLVCGGERRGK